MALQKQMMTLLISFQSIFGHASKQPNTGAVLELVELSSNRTLKYITADLSNDFDSSANRKPLQLESQL
jgi:hypothetical protein